MPFAYYRSLSRKDKAIYDASDRVASIALPRAEALHPVVEILRLALERDDRALVEAAAARLVAGITALLEVEAVDVRVLAVRPELRSAELHGLYTRDDRAPPAHPGLDAHPAATSAWWLSAPSCARCSTSCATTSTTRCSGSRTRSTPRASSAARAPVQAAGAGAGAPCALPLPLRPLPTHASTRS